MSQKDEQSQASLTKQEALAKKRAEALRANLRRRKDQANGRDDDKTMINQERLE
ncbi:MAG: hypothetical protein KDJ26_08845 [Alphaproteobacteria bacterium]|jgi:hypothetical protein|nr:hypothetical protein [Alphaproteobacteria bacterium]MCB1552086.1 hypothetical protein [Alphaproteobacteria bacterium]MCB9984355.1 hypothetical protein [Micavibrio sp.]HRK97879.1 hypothetical protein [Alphaproteobacteria bacterium]